MNEPRNFKILCIDGGGIKGTYSAFLLSAIENQLGNGKTIGQYFHMVAGTSTGSLIALGIAAGKSAKEIAATYESDGHLIFNDHNRLRRIWKTIQQGFISARYDTTQLCATVERIVGETKMSESKNYVCVPVTVINSYAPRIYKTRHGEKHSWKNVSFKHVGLASSAAPTFFPLVESEAVAGTLYADGGLFANNPALVALIDAFQVFVGPDSERKEFDTVSILSIGSFPSPVSFKVSGWRSSRWLPQKLRQYLKHAWRSRPARGWMLPVGGTPPLVDVLMQTQGKYIENALPILQNAFASKFSSYVRLDATRCKAGSGSAPNDLTTFSLSDGRPEQIEEMKRLGENDGLTSASDPKVRNFFRNEIGSITLHPHPQ